ncbi:hypothetical protein BC829DRAFT_363071 [Chytridium lagenaria]|nr:hypothetical protein BC829DRAFT_363071 [Chytridium lagenaria]
MQFNVSSFTSSFTSLSTTRTTPQPTPPPAQPPPSPSPPVPVVPSAASTYHHQRYSTHAFLPFNLYLQLSTTLHIVGETVNIPTVPPVTLYRRSISDVKFFVASGEAGEGEEGRWLENVVLGDSDLVDGDYEGGFKTWECSLDLVAYLTTIDIAQKRAKLIIQLGCGSGLPGLYCMKQNCTVDFQDYNEEVLRLVTLPNVLLNVATPPEIDENGTFETEVSGDVLLGVGFLKGDWGLQVRRSCTVDGGKYDVVLSSETIYSAEMHGDLHDAIERSLERPHGLRNFIAAKMSYFGCTGTLLTFLELVASRGVFKSEIVWTRDEGVARRIVRLSFV